MPFDKSAFIPKPGKTEFTKEEQRRGIALARGIDPSEVTDEDLANNVIAEPVVFTPTVVKKQ